MKEKLRPIDAARLQRAINREPVIMVDGLRYIRADMVAEKIRMAPTIAIADSTKNDGD